MWPAQFLYNSLEVSLQKLLCSSGNGQIAIVPRCMAAANLTIEILFELISVLSNDPTAVHEVYAEPRLLQGAQSLQNERQSRGLV